MTTGPWRILAVLPVLLFAPPGAVRPAATQEPMVTAADLAAAIGDLGRLDYATRMGASRTVRRAPAALAVPALMEAASSHVDGYVRYRALVLLSGFNDPRTRDIMEESLGDRNDRLRAVAYTYFQYTPDQTVVPLLLEALEKETSEFVRPQLTRALAAYGQEPRVRAALVPLVDRGQDFFRAVVIEALGEYEAGYAVEAIDRVARLEGPLRDDAAIALGRIGQETSLATLADLQRVASRDEQPAIAAGICLLGVNCASHIPFIESSLGFGIDNLGYQALVRSAANALAALAVEAHPEVVSTLIRFGVPSRDPARAPIALALGTVAIRNTAILLSVLERDANLDGAVLLLRDAFDMLEEDYEEERFFAAVRRTYWQAEDGSALRRVADALIQGLEF